ncbi:D-aspartate oxidase [Crucibulum laeve]|uniref:D-aspartate oxidase n=1 Tax=Crucibulum laeve TaxID=68775 RepID=A0A5C3MJZ6_9AGAR|nr:D-aspartate oxidase [Crucibulum laeve]
MTKEIVVLGAGVIGLTTALQIQEKGGYHVTIIAEVLPSDPKTIKYTSHWAGAHHVSLANEGTLQHRLDSETFTEMWKLSAPGAVGEGCFLRLHQREFYDYVRSEDVLLAMPNHQPIPDNELVPGAVEGVSFDTITVDIPVYLNYLMARFLAGGGSVVRGAVQHINQVIEGGVSLFSNGKGGACRPDAIIVCVGLGARTLGGIEDKSVMPIRGQTVLLRAPWVRVGSTLKKDGGWTYIIPRRSGNVVVGGTKEENDWYPLPRPETTLDILKRALLLCPDLAPPEVRAQRQPAVEDLQSLILEECCGLRPYREGGMRLEVERLQAPNGAQVPIIHNYGHGPAGYMSSFGSASVALDLLEKSFKLA